MYLNKAPWMPFNICLNLCKDKLWCRLYMILVSFLAKMPIFIVYVDDLLMYGCDKALVNSFVDYITNKEEV